MAKMKNIDIEARAIFASKGKEACARFLIDTLKITQEEVSEIVNGYQRYGIRSSRKKSKDIR